MSDPTPENPAADDDMLLRALERLRGNAGNQALQRALDWTPDIYWKVRDRLVDAGRLELGRGKGGSVRLVGRIDDAVPATSQAVTVAGGPVSEAQLYGPVAAVLGNSWARDMRFRSHHVEITARQGRRDTGGTWTRPDIVVAALRLFPHVPGKYFDLITFELKAFDGIDVTAVFEALAHRRAATQAYVWLHIPTGLGGREDVEGHLERIGEEARRHGVGLIVGADPADYETWDIELKAVRVEPDPEFMNEFIAQQLPDATRNELAQWFR